MKTRDKQRMLHLIYVIVIGFSCFFQQAWGTIEEEQRLEAERKKLADQVAALHDMLRELNTQLVTQKDKFNNEQEKFIKKTLENFTESVVKPLQAGMQGSHQLVAAAIERALADAKTLNINLTDRALDPINNVARILEELRSDMSKSPLQKGLGRLFTTLSDMVKDPKVMMGTIALITGTVIAKKMAEHGVEKLRAAWDKPPLVYETNVRTIMDSILRRAPAPKIESQKDLVYSPELQKDLARILSMTKKARILNEEYSHFMLYGPPGTGKTAFAKMLAQQSGMKYAIISGASFATFNQESQAILEFVRVLEWAKHNKEPLMIIIDEAESALTSREDSTCTDLQRNLVVTLLNYVQKPTSKEFLLVLLSNLPHRLDIAVRDRMGEKVEIPLPGLRERRIIFEKYVKKEIVARRAQAIDPKIEADIKQEDSKLGEMMQGLSGRAIESMVKQMRSQARFEGSKVLTYEIAERVIKARIEEERKGTQKYDVHKIKQDALKLNATPSAVQTALPAAAA